MSLHHFILAISIITVLFRISLIVHDQHSDTLSEVSLMDHHLLHLGGPHQHRVDHCYDYATYKTCPVDEHNIHLKVSNNDSNQPWQDDTYQILVARNAFLLAQVSKELCLSLKVNAVWKNDEHAEYSHHDQDSIYWLFAEDEPFK